MLKIRNRFVRIATRTLLYAGIVLLLFLTAASVYIEINKKEILADAVSSVNKKINGKISYGRADISVWKNFPFIGLQIFDAKLTDSLNTPLLDMQRISFRVSMVQIVRKKTVLNHLSLKNGSILLYTDTSGYTNKYVFDRDPDTDQQKNKFDIDHAEMENVRVVIDNRKKNKRFDVLFKSFEADISNSSDDIRIDINQHALIHGLGFNLAKGSYLKQQTFKGRTRLRYDKDLSTLSFEGTKVKIGDQPYVLSGLFRLKKTGSFRLNIRTKEATLAKIKSIFADSTFQKLKGVHLERPIDAEAILEGSLGYKTIPRITASWNVRDNELVTPVATISDCSFAGTFTNEVIKGVPLTDANSGIALSEFSGNWEGIHLKSRRITVTDLVQPKADMSLQSSADLASLNEKLGLRTIRFLGGTAALNFHYNGPLEKEVSILDKLNGSLRFANAAIKYIPRDFTFRNCSGNVVFSSDALQTKDLKFDLGSNHFDVAITGTNLSGLSVADAGKAVIECKVFTPSLNLAELKSLFSSKKQVSAGTGKAKMLSATTKIDEALDHGQLRILLNATSVRYKDFMGSNLKGSVTFFNNDLQLSGVSVDHAEGNLSLDGKILQQGQINAASAKVRLNNVDVSKVFRAFDDFGQDGISFQNLRGRLNANTNISMVMDQTGRIVPGSMKGIVEFSLKNGALLNYEPMQHIKGFVFKNKDMSNVTFAELKNKLEIRDHKISIPRMEIQSTAIGMFVEGVYDMRKSDSKIEIQVPLKGLKKRDSTYLPQNIGVDAKAGTSIYLEGKNDKTGKVKIGLNTTKTIRKIF